MSAEADDIAGDLPDGVISITPSSGFAVPGFPSPATSFIGRERITEAVAELVRDPSIRLITLTGTGGIGKTRLALAVAKDIAGAVAFVSLAATGADLVAATIARSLNLDPAPGQATCEGLRDALRAQELVLVLDNFEHVLAASPVVSELMSACPGLTILVTSRVRLGISGEHAVAVDPLELPDPVRAPSLDVAMKSAAVRLFVERARVVQPGFALTEHNTKDVLAICQRLDGLPLAIELAAARCKLLSPEALAARLERRLVLLTGGPRDVPARLQTMRAAIAWSSDLLNDAEQALWERLGVFCRWVHRRSSRGRGLDCWRLHCSTTRRA